MAPEWGDWRVGHGLGFRAAADATSVTMEQINPIATVITAPSPLHRDQQFVT
jgi:hypothetical protein